MLVLIANNAFNTSGKLLSRAWKILVDPDYRISIYIFGLIHRRFITGFAFSCYTVLLIG